MTIGQRIKAARKEVGMTQVDLAKKLNISYVNISQLEKDQRNPTLGTLQRIADALGVDPYSLYSWNQASAALEARINARDRVDTALGKLNDAGMEKAADAVEVIAEVPRYRRQEAPQPPADASRDTAPAPPEGSEKPTGGSETPPEGE